MRASGSGLSRSERQDLYGRGRRGARRGASSAAQGASRAGRGASSNTSSRGGYGVGERSVAGRRLGTSDESSPFQFGYRYTHFFYTMSPHPPFRLLATSSEFCLASAQDASDCESVQFISGIELEATGADKSNRTEGRRMRNADTLLMSYGINDCEAKLARMPLSAVLQMLKPLTGERAVCTPVAGTRP